MTAPTLRLDIVSDIVCPWCAIGFARLEKALQKLDDIPVEIHWQPFELAPHLPSGGENLRTFLTTKFQASEEQIIAMQREYQQTAAAEGVEFNYRADSRRYNTFNAHQLLHWASSSDRQTALKQALFNANFRDNLAIDDSAVLAELAAGVGLDGQQAKLVIEQQRFADEVRKTQRQWQQLGVNSVPCFIVNQRYQLSGAQSPENLAQALQQIANEA